MDPILMIPGPVEVPEDIYRCYTGRTVAHYGAEWTAFFLRATARLSAILGTRGPCFTLPGSGSLGLEAAALSFGSGKRCAVLSNGFFGDRLCQVFAPHAESLKEIRFGVGTPIDVDIVGRELKTTRHDVLVCTQVETSTGMLNPVEQVARACRDQGVMCIVDAVSSAAVEEMAMDSWGIDVLVTASQKGFECPPGLAVVACSRAAADRLNGRKAAAWYTDLAVWQRYHEEWLDWHPYPVTLPTNCVKALAKSAEVIEEEGLAHRLATQRDTAAAFRGAVTALGLNTFISDAHCAHGLTAVAVEGRFAPSELVAYLRDSIGVEIAGSLGELKTEIFRVGHMSRVQQRPHNLAGVIVGIGAFMRRNGLDCDIGSALARVVPPRG